MEYKSFDKKLQMTYNHYKVNEQLIIWDLEKDQKLQRQRGISFTTVAQKISKKEVLNIVHNPNQKHAHQWLIIFKHERYTWVAPCLIEHNLIIIKTAFPSRKFHKKYQ